MYHIQKEQQIQDNTDIIYYSGVHRWTTVFEDRIIYETEEEATQNLYDFGGEISADVVGE